MWLSEQLPTFVKQSVVGPLKTHKELFTDDNILPVQRCNMVFGRDGVGKRTALEYILNEESISFVTIDAENMDGHTEGNYNDAQVLIIQNANSLVVGPYTTNESRKFALELKKMTRSMNIFIFCLVNIVPQNMTLGETDLLAVQVLRNFDATIYFESPTVEFRGQIFKKCFAEFFDHVGDRCVDNISDEAYNLLVDSSAYATPAQIRTFVNRVALVSIQSVNTSVDIELIKQCMFSIGPGTWSITKGISGNIEDRFAAAAGYSIPSGRAQKEYERQQLTSGFILEAEKRPREEDDMEEEEEEKKLKI